MRKIGFIFMQQGISKFIAAETEGISYSCQKFCLDNFEISGFIYDDPVNITVKRYGETEKWRVSRDLSGKAAQIKKIAKPIFRFFLDGSKRTYKVDDVAYGNRVYPIVGGQIGVGCCERIEKEIHSKLLYNSVVLSLPEKACTTNRKILFFNNLTTKLNQHPVLMARNLQIKKCLFYEDKSLQLGERYENLAIATIQDEMIEQEKRIVADLVTQNLLSEDAYLFKDGSLEYKTMAEGDYKDLSVIKSNYKRVVGVSKSFNPEKCIDEHGKSNAKHIVQLPLYHRTPAYLYESNLSKGAGGIVKFAIWYVRIREAKYTNSPFDGLVKVEKILVNEQEQERGLLSEEVDLISANIINERNPVCYGKDGRWANTLYPIYLTSMYIKSKYIGNQHFLNLF